MEDEKARYTMIQPPPQHQDPAQRAQPGGYTIMVAGRRTGKTSFCRLLLDAGLNIAPDAHPEQLASVASFVQQSNGSHTREIRTVTIDVQVQIEATAPAELVTLSIIDTPSLGFKTNDGSDERLVQDMIRHCEDRFAGGRNEDRNREDYVHLCLYFLCPDTIVPPPAPARSFSHPEAHPDTSPGIARAALPTLPTADIQAIRDLSARVNVLPVIARADLLSNDRLNAIRAAIRRDLAGAGIGFGIFDTDTTATGSPTTSNTAKPTSWRLPYALISPDLYAHSDGVYALKTLSRHELIQQYTGSASKPFKLPRGTYTRSYRWGEVDVLNPDHSDFAALCSAVFCHMQTLKDYTKGYLYRKFRSERERPMSYISHPTQIPMLSHGPRPLLAIDTTSPNISNSHRRGSVSVAAGRSSTMDQTMSARSPTSAHSSSGARIKKITVACQFCRSRKLKCNGGRPACAQCTKRNNPCDYFPHRRRGSTKQRKSGDESESEASAEELEREGASLSPVAPIASRSRRNSNVERPGINERQPNMERRSSLVDRRNSIIERTSSDDTRTELPPILGHKSSGSSGSRSLFKDNELPSISTLALPDASLSSSRMSAPPPPLIRSEMDQQAVQRRRAATGITRFPSVAGPKTQACNFCRTRKTKCDGASPACASCARRGLGCDYAAPHPGKKGGRRASTAASTAVPMASTSGHSKSNSVSETKTASVLLPHVIQPGATSATPSPPAHLPPTMVAQSPEPSSKETTESAPSTTSNGGGVGSGSGTVTSTATYRYVQDGPETFVKRPFGSASPEYPSKKMRMVETSS